MKTFFYNLFRFCTFTVLALTLSSTYAAENEIKLSSSVSAFVQKISVSVGEQVEAGETLIELKPDVVRHDAQARKSMRKLANMELTEAKAQFARQQELFDIGSLSSVELDHHRLILQRRQTAFDVASAESGKADLKLAQHKINAPVNAVVKSINVSIGEFVNAAVENKVLIILVVE